VKESKICTLALFTWICVQSDGRMEAVPRCPTHTSSKTRFAPFGTGMIITCHENRNHLVSLCARAQFEAERAEAEFNLF
jgi:ribosomal protein L35